MLLPAMDENGLPQRFIMITCKITKNRINPYKTTLSARKTTKNVEYPTMADDFYPGRKILCTGH
jgi:hypothetical protein